MGHPGTASLLDGNTQFLDRETSVSWFPTIKMSIRRYIPRVRYLLIFVSGFFLCFHDILCWETIRLAFSSVFQTRGTATEDGQEGTADQTATGNASSSDCLRDPIVRCGGRFIRE